MFAGKFLAGLQAPPGTQWKDASTVARSAVWPRTLALHGTSGRLCRGFGGRAQAMLLPGPLHAPRGVSNGRLSGG
jgi:hypothetical protein